MEIKTDIIVYKSDFGIRMHLKDSCPTILHKNIQKITVKEGQEIGMKFCAKCCPKNLIKNESNFPLLNNNDIKDINILRNMYMTNYNNDKKLMKKINFQKIIRNNNENNIQNLIPKDFNQNSLSAEKEKSISFVESNYLLNENNNINTISSSAIVEGINCDNKPNENKENNKLNEKEKNNEIKSKDNIPFKHFSLNDNNEIIKSNENFINSKSSKLTNLISANKIYLRCNISLFYNTENDYDFIASNALNCKTHNAFYYSFRAKAKKDQKAPIRLLVGYSIYEIITPQKDGDFSAERYIYSIKLDNINKIYYLILDIQNNCFFIYQKKENSLKCIYKRSIHIESLTKKKFLPYIISNQFDNIELKPNKEDNK